MHDYLLLGEVAAVARTSIDSVRGWLRSGRLPSVKQGRRRLVRPEELAFGDMCIDKLHVSHVEAWKLGIAGLIKASVYSPTTADGWLAILRVIMRAAKPKYGLSHFATEA